MIDPKALAETTATLVKGYVGKALAPIVERLVALEARAPERGEKGDPGDIGPAGERGAAGERGEKGDPGEPGAQGDRGEKGDTGERGPEGPAGRDGRDGLPGVPGTAGEKGMDGRDGRDGTNGMDGRDGKDGLGFDDLEFSHDGERGFVLRFVQGERVKEFPFTLPVVLDRGVYKAEAAYAKGDAVTWAGSLWIAQEDTAEKPDTGKGWRLAVKRGRDGKDAR